MVVLEAFGVLHAAVLTVPCSPFPHPGEIIINIPYLGNMLSQSFECCLHGFGNIYPFVRIPAGHYQYFTDLVGFEAFL